MMMRHERAMTLFCHQSCPEPSTTNSLRYANTVQPTLKKSREAFLRRPRTNSEFFGPAKRRNPVQTHGARFIDYALTNALTH